LRRARARGLRRRRPLGARLARQAQDADGPGPAGHAARAARVRVPRGGLGRLRLGGRRMRGQLRGGLLAAALASSPSGPRARWGAGVDARTSLYQDTDRTTISTTIVGARISPNDRWSLSGHYLADIITSASVDVVTSATAKGRCGVMAPAPASCPPEPF